MYDLDDLILNMHKHYVDNIDNVQLSRSNNLMLEFILNSHDKLEALLLRDGITIEGDMKPNFMSSGDNRWWPCGSLNFGLPLTKLYPHNSIRISFYFGDYKIAQTVSVYQTYGLLSSDLDRLMPYGFTKTSVDPSIPDQQRAIKKINSVQDIWWP